MNISGIFNNLGNKAKLSVLSEKNAKEVRELCDDLSQFTQYKNVELQLKDKDNVTVLGKDLFNNSMTINMDFKNNVQNQVEKTKYYAFSLLPQHREFTQEIRGNIGGPIKRVRTTEICRNDAGTNYIKTTEYKNMVSGNCFKRQETPEGVTFYRNVDGNFVEMFKK